MSATLEKLNPEIKQDWLERLRSGDYNQGKAVLRREDRFCCLGVLCDALASRKLGWWKSDRFHIDTDWTAGSVPITLAKSIGLYGDVPETEEPVQEHLYHMNDLHDKSFGEIADWIEENL